MYSPCGYDSDCDAVANWPLYVAFGWLIPVYAYLVIGGIVLVTIKLIRNCISAVLLNK